MNPPVLYFDLGNTLVSGPTGNKTPLPDAVATIDTLWERGYRIGILSNQPVDMTLEAMPDKLDGYGLESWKFDVITISSEFDPPIWKPDPDIYSAAAAKAGYSSGSDRTVFITETLGHIEAARDLGWRAIHIPYNAACTAASGECVEALDDLLDLFPPLPIDLYFRDNTADDGDEPSTGTFWNSPDLWVRNAADDSEAHQNPVAGQDNWLYARVHNRGEGIGRVGLVGHAIQEWAGTQFVYPADFAPVVGWVGAINVEPDASRTVRLLWPADQVPAEGTHACWLAIVLHNADPLPPSPHVWEANNFAQKNLTIVEMGAGESASLSVVIGNRAIREARLAVLEIRRRGRPLTVSLDADSAPALSRAVRRAGAFRRGKPVPLPEPDMGLRFLDTTRVELTGFMDSENETAILELARGSIMRFPRLTAIDPPRPKRHQPRVPLDARLVESKKGAGSIVFGDGVASGIELGLRSTELIRAHLTLRAPKDAKPGERFNIDLIQRDEEGRVVGGVSYAIAITRRTRKKGGGVAAKRPKKQPK